MSTPNGLELVGRRQTPQTSNVILYLQSVGRSWNALLGQIHIRYPAVKLMQACDPGHSTRTFSAILSRFSTQGVEARVPVGIYLCMCIRCVTDECHFLHVNLLDLLIHSDVLWILRSKPQTLCKRRKSFTVVVGNKLINGRDTIMTPQMLLVTRFFYWINKPHQNRCLLKQNPGCVHGSVCVAVTLSSGPSWVTCCCTKCTAGRMNINGRLRCETHQKNKKLVFRQRRAVRSTQP